MTEHGGYDEEERAWATRLARAFLAPPEPTLVAGDEAAPPTVVALVAVVPVAVPVPAHDEAGGDEAVRRRGDDEQEGAGDG